jgi:BirA family biotin operon repressor/biotin-[acetyl-CoA-carboxylase] ligase
LTTANTANTAKTANTADVAWDAHTAGDLARLCEVPRLELLAETESTQNVAHALAEQGAPAGTTVLADAQTAGRGRMGRSWMSEPGRGVWCTVIERPADSSAMDVLSLRVGLAAAETLDAFAGGPVGVKWPNDLMLRSSVIPRSVATRDLQFGKLGGILVEARWSGTSLAWVAVGVGVNVVAPLDVPGAVALPRGVSRTSVLAAIVRAVRSAATATGHLTRDELSRYRSRDILAGRRILLPAAGTVAGITQSGSLVVDTDNGQEQVRAGTIQLAPEEHA